MATIKVHFEARHPSNGFTPLAADSLEKLQSTIKADLERFETKAWGDPANKAYWIKHYKELTLHKVTTIVEDL
jgi:hypothetical protein